MGEDGLLFETSLGGGEWGTQEEAEEKQWRQKQREKREAEEAARVKERDHAREERRRQDEQRRRQQIEELEKELCEETRRERQLDGEQANPDKPCRCDTEAATRIQAHYRGRQVRGGQRQ